MNCAVPLLRVQGKRIWFPLKSVGYELFSRAVASQVSSPLQSLTSVFGMGTGGPSALKTLTIGHKLLPDMVRLRGLEPRTH